MRNPFPPVFANIFKRKLENHVVIPKDSPFYDPFVDDIFTNRSKAKANNVQDLLNSYHKNITFTEEENPANFLYTAFNYNASSFITRVYKKTTSYLSLVFQSSKQLDIECHPYSSS